MVARLGVSVGGAAIPAAAAITGAADGWCALVVAVFAALIPVALVVPMAPYIKALHHLPLFGAPQLRARFTVDGRAELKVGIRRKEPLFAPPEDVRLPEWYDPSAPPNFEPRTAHVCVGIHNPARLNIDRATITFMHPEGLPHEETEPRGELSNEGKWMPPTAESLTDRGTWSDYWVRTTTLDAGVHRLFFFELTFPAPGTYPLRLRVNSADLHEPYVRNADIQVEEVERGKEPAVDRMAYVIQEAEELLADIEDPSVAVDERQRIAAIYLEAANTIPEGRDDLHAVLKKRPPSLPRGNTYSSRLLRAYITSFYDLRQRLAT